MVTMTVVALFFKVRKALNRPGSHVGGCQNYGPFLGTLNSRCRIIIGIQKATIILTHPCV